MNQGGGKRRRSLLNNKHMSFCTVFIFTGEYLIYETNDTGGWNQDKKLN